jgi:hypothetical protein
MKIDLSLVHYKMPKSKIIGIKAAHHYSKGSMAVDLNTENEMLIKEKIKALYREYYVTVTLLMQGPVCAGEAIFPISELIQ